MSRFDGATKGPWYEVENLPDNDGQWLLLPDDHKELTARNDGFLLAVFEGPDAKPNANLAAAAPALLAAGEKLAEAGGHGFLCAMSKADVCECGWDEALAEWRKVTK